MTSESLSFHASPPMRGPRMVLGFSGWMDGGNVSTGTVETLIQKLGAQALADIDPDEFYLLSFPGSMDVASMFRPHVKIEDGLLTAYREPINTFFYSEPHDLILFAGREPHLKWPRYAECIFSVAERFAVSRIYFVGSVAGLVPHTREPRLFCSVSDAALKPELDRMGIRFSNYEGPASIVTLLTRMARGRDVPMLSFVAEIPAYVQGRNPRCIEAMTRRLAGMLNLPIRLDELRALSDQLEQRLDEVVAERPELSERIRSLEEDYDSEVFDTQMDDLKEWLEAQGIRLD